MARPPRLAVPGALYHVTLRGKGPPDIVLAAGDRRVILDVLATVCHRLGCLCDAYCHMTNYHHGMIVTPEGDLVQGMQPLKGVHRPCIDQLRGHMGHSLQ